MKLNGDFIIRNIAGDNVLIPTGKTAMNFNGMIILNETGVFIWKLLTEGEKDQNEILKKITEEFEIDEESAKKDLEVFIERLVQEGLVSD